MKYLSPLLLLVISLSANDVTSYFKEDKKHNVLCRSGYESYTLLNQDNAKISKINGNLFFKLKNKNNYIPTSACSSVTKRTGIIF